MRENRNHERVACHIEVDFFTGNQEGKAVLTNLSRGGVCLRCQTDQPLTGIVGFNSRDAQEPTRFGLIAWHDARDSENHLYGLQLCKETEWLEKILVPWKREPRRRGSLSALSLNLAIEGALA